MPREEALRRLLSQVAGGRAGEVAEAMKDVAWAARKAVELGLTSLSWGNISVRVGDFVAITPSGVDMGEIEWTDIVIITMGGVKLLGLYEPSSEYRLHLEIYKRRRANAVVHLHPPFVTAFALAGRPIKPVLAEAELFLGGEVRVVGYAPPGTQELAVKVAEEMGDGKAVIMERHGLVAVGHTVFEALRVALVVEETARAILLSRCLDHKI